MTEAELRREKILALLRQNNAPLKASTLAGELNVSRQVVVGDVALLRARGNKIIATARGYMTTEGENKYIGKVACRHAPEDTKKELYAIVDSGAVVLNIIVEHEIYGEITGSLNIRERGGVDDFINKIGESETRLLSELTAGVHTHTIACRDKANFDEVRSALKKIGFLI